MATLFGDNATLAESNEPAEKINVNAGKGRLRVIYDEITLAAELTAADIIKMGAKIPKGAKLYDARLISPQLGSAGGAGELDLGWAAGINGDEAADADGIFDGVEVGSAAASVKLQDDGAAGALGKEFAEEVQIQLTANETTDAGIGDKIQLFLYFALD